MDAAATQDGMAPSATTRRYRLILTDDLLPTVEEWRRKQPDIPNRSEAIRRMVRIAADLQDERDSAFKPSSRTTRRTGKE